MDTSEPIPSSIFPNINPWQELTTAAMLIMEVSWIALLYSVLSLEPTGLKFGNAFLVFFGVLTIAYLLPRLMSTIGLKLRFRRWVFGILILFSLYSAIQWLSYASEQVSLAMFLPRLITSFINAEFIPPEFWTLLVILLLWRRGASLAHSSIDSGHILASFKIGMLMFIAIGLIRPHAEVLLFQWVLFLFAFSGLFSLSLSRIHEVSQVRGGKKVHFNRSWLIGISLTILLILAVGFLTSNLLQVQLIEITRFIVRIVSGLFMLIVFILVLPVIGLFLLLLPWLEQIMENFAALQLLQEISESFSDVLSQLSENVIVEEAVDVINAGKTLALVGILVVVGLTILLGLKWMRSRDRQVGEDQGEMVIAPGDVLGLIRKRAKDLVGSLFNRFNLRRARQTLAAARIRWIYAQLMDLSSRLDHPRPPAATPIEFLPILSAIFPNNVNDLEDITSAYLQVRYGEIPENQEELTAIQQSWEQVKQEGRRQLIDFRRKKKTS